MQLHPKITGMSPLLIVTDINRSVAFYTTILGFKIDFLYEDFYVGIIKDVWSIHLKHGTPNSAERSNRRRWEDVDLLFTIENINTFYQFLNQTDVDVVQPLRKMDYGTEFYIADPDGYIIAFVEQA